jgi:hypothetical protein
MEGLFLYAGSANSVARRQLFQQYNAVMFALP